MGVEHRGRDLRSEFKVSPGVFVEARDGYEPRQLAEIYERLKVGLRDEEDPVTWRTTLERVKFLCGVEDPIDDPLPEQTFDQAYQMIESLVGGTFHAPLIPEMFLGMGISEEVIRSKISWEPHIDSLVINGRHLGVDKDGRRFDPEKCLYGIVRELFSRGQAVAFSNFVGRFGDNKNRVAAIYKLLHKVDRVVVVGSTQEMGAHEALTDTLISIAHPDFLGQVEYLDIVIPMYGGSRADRPGQPTVMARESLAAIENARRLSQEVMVVQSRLVQYGLTQDQLPKVCFYTVDIHGDKFPKSVFDEFGFAFESISPEEVFATRICTELSTLDCQDLPMKVTIFDKGATERSSRFVIALLGNPQGCWDHVDVIFVDKTRVTAGEVKSVQVSRIERWSLGQNGVQIDELWSLDSGVNFHFDDEDVPTMENPSLNPCVIASIDDILDTGGTTQQNRRAEKHLYRGDVVRISSYSHLVASRGVPLAVQRDQANLMLAGNSLTPQGLLSTPRVRSVDLSGPIVDAILNE